MNLYGAWAWVALALSACGGATPDGAHPPPRRRLVQTFAAYRADEAHDPTENVDPANVPAGIEVAHENGPGFYRVASGAPAEASETLRSFVRTLRLPEGDLVLLGASSPPRTYLVQPAPIVDDRAIAYARPMTRRGAGLAVTFTPDAYATLWTALHDPGHVLFVVEGAVEAAPFEIIDPYDPEQYDPNDPPPKNPCLDRTLFLPLAARDGEPAEARATRLAAALPSTRKAPVCPP